MLAFMFGGALAAALLFGLAPALQATRFNVMQAAHGDFSSAFRTSRLRNALVLTQVTVCALLLITSGVLLRSSNTQMKLDPGLNPQGVLELIPREETRAAVLANLAADPGIKLVAASEAPPFHGKFPFASATGAEIVRNGLPYNHVSPEFFEVLDIPVLRGRNFTAEEAASGAPVTILSETAARRLWPAGDALGQAYWVSAALGLLALMLAVLGIYGVMSFAVAQRTKEIGIRMAIGAGAATVVRMILRQSMRLAIRGAGLGLLLALCLAKLFSTRLVLDEYDPPAYAVALIAVLAACACAALVPAVRAARVDPVTTLRHD